MAARSQIMPSKKLIMERDPCFFGNEDYLDSSKVHIADTVEEYQDWQNNIVKIS